jgi:catechol 2,3-dioxygenase-like lactoylglutathione lyase family enzyme
VITGLDHVQLAAPPGSEPRLRAFYGGVLGMAELTKPPVLAGRGGCWFTAGGAVLHLGIEEDFRPARKAHPGLRVTGIHPFAKGLQAKDVKVVWDYDLPGHLRFTCEDPVGNRLEFLEPTTL